MHLNKENGQQIVQNTVQMEKQRNVQNKSLLLKSLLHESNYVPIWKAMFQITQPKKKHLLKISKLFSPLYFSKRKQHFYYFLLVHLYMKLHYTYHSGFIEGCLSYLQFLGRNG